MELEIAYFGFIAGEMQKIFHKAVSEDANVYFDLNVQHNNVAVNTAKELKTNFNRI